MLPVNNNTALSQQRILIFCHTMAKHRNTEPSQLFVATAQLLKLNFSLEKYDETTINC